LGGGHGVSEGKGVIEGFEDKLLRLTENPWFSVQKKLDNFIFSMVIFSLRQNFLSENFLM
jgi:hypothetical protein